MVQCWGHKDSSLSHQVVIPPFLHLISPVLPNLAFLVGNKSLENVFDVRRIIFVLEANLEVDVVYEVGPNVSCGIVSIPATAV